ncbi:LysR family transcriptional regulator [Paraburkholderia sp. BCC1876]|uniref:LysR substrate-binding domain-containing protein n=1 Tax=Paraburkholderia sp. BCC1876 TaxID=2676303 RepID=UPI001591CF90|nr:LysR family transcriptional regulator [Paraburkholderia sp. BCC1876]
MTLKSPTSPKSHIPPLASLRAFEATVRLGGFARAAVELSVSTSAVSHQIRGLEDLLGARLLERSTGLGGIGLTEAGASLLPAVSHALSLLEEACSQVKGVPKKLTVAANGSFSSMWLARRLAEFSARYPETPLSAITLDGEPEFARHEVDVAIVHIHVDKVRADDLVLFREEVFPVCAPELHPFASKAVCRCRLLQETHENAPEFEWRNWKGQFGLPSDFETKIVRYSGFSQVLGAAIGGAGIALGRLPLIEADLRSGRLMRLFPDLSRPASWCFVLRTAPERRHKLLEPLIEFLRLEAALPAAQASSSTVAAGV